MDRDVTVMADDECLSLPARHDLFPDRGHSSSGHLEVFQLPHVVDVDPVVRSADLTGVREEPCDQLISWTDVMPLEWTVLDRGEPVDLERYVAKHGYVLRPAVRPRLRGLQDPLGAAIAHVMNGGVFPPHGGGSRLVDRCQCPEQ